MLKSKYEQMPPKTITYQSYKNLTEEQFKEAIRSYCSYIGGGNLTFLQNIIEQRLDHFAPFFFNWDSLHARLNSHYEAWSYKKKKHTKEYRLQKICLERTYS